MIQHAVVWDLDGLFYDTQPEMELELLHHTGVLFPMREWNDWNAVFKKALEVSGEPAEVVLEWLFGDAVIARAKPSPGIQEVVARFNSAGIKQAVASSRPIKQLDLTVGMLALDFPQIVADDVFLLLKGTPSPLHKSIVVQQYDADALFDDHGELVLEVRRILGYHKKFYGLVDKPWNWHITFEEDDGIVRLGNWDNNDYGWDVLLNRFVS